MLIMLRKYLSHSGRFSVPRVWEATRKYWFSLLFVSILCAKLLHLFSHRNSLAASQFLAWGATFFVQDAVCIAISWALTRQFEHRWVRILIPLGVMPAAIGISFMSSANMSFFVTTGAEIHWRQAHNFHRDFASIKTLLSGLAGMVMVEMVFLIVSYFASPRLFDAVDEYMDVLGSCIAPLWVCRRGRTKSLGKSRIYESLADDDLEETESLQFSQPQKLKQRPRPSLFKRVCVLLPTVVILWMDILRPFAPAYGFLSQTLPLSPFAGPNTDNRNTLLGIPDLPDEYSWLTNRTALATPMQFDWLPSDALPGFRDWYFRNTSKPVHYDPKQDPLHVSNLKNEVIEPLRKALKSGNVKIKHVLLLKLESTRYDVFPVRPDNYIHDRIRQSYGGHIPDDVEERLASLTRTAERLVGIPSGFNGERVQPYGGFHASNSHTAGTFTLKSITGSVCGITPLVVDFNREYLQHIYQPCMPHILEALNAQAESDNKTDNFTSWPWKSISMQSITDLYDNQNLLTPELGFENVVNVDTIDANYANDTSVQAEKINFWGYHDSKLRSYFRDAIQKAEKDNERLFITHLTGGTHHPWDTPFQKYNEMVGSTWLPINRHFNRYMNTIGLSDLWVGEILQILEETGVANETLVVMTGDHGITLPEDGGVTPYDNPHISNFHVPLIFAHPQLPSIEIDSAVTSIQILPTILDLLRESGSVDKASMKVINDLIPLYEGQSIIRTPVTEQDGKQVWQFSVMNTGGTWLAVRSAANPYRLVIPLIPDVEWRFSDVSVDPQEVDYLMSFDLPTLLELAAEKHPQATQWIKDAAYASKWWLQDNWRRYEYEP